MNKIDSTKALYASLMYPYDIKIITTQSTVCCCGCALSSMLIVIAPFMHYSYAFSTVIPYKHPHLSKIIFTILVKTWDQIASCKICKNAKYVLVSVNPEAVNSGVDVGFILSDGCGVGQSLASESLQ